MILTYHKRLNTPTHIIAAGVSPSASKAPTHALSPSKAAPVRSPCDTLSVAWNTADQPAPLPDIRAVPSAGSCMASGPFCRTHRFPTHLMTCFTPSILKFTLPGHNLEISFCQEVQGVHWPPAPPPNKKYFLQITQKTKNSHPPTHHMTFSRLSSTIFKRIYPSRSQPKIFILPRGSRRTTGPGQACREKYFSPSRSSRQK